MRNGKGFSSNLLRPNAGLAILLGVAGCASTDLSRVAPVPEAPTTAGVLRGRSIYVTRCAKCHAPEPVRKYSAAQWREIIPDMAEETRLSAADTQAVTDYIFAVLALP